MSIFGFSLLPTTSFENLQYNLQPVFFLGGTFLTEKLFDRAISLAAADYQIGFIKPKKIVSIGLATYTTLKIMELAKLISSVPFIAKVFGAASLIALLTSAGVTWRKTVEPEKPLKAADDPAPRFSALQQYCLSLKNQGKPFHCSIELINPKDAQPYLIHIIYKPQKDEEIKLFLSSNRYATSQGSYMIISPIDTDPYTDTLLTNYLGEIIGLGQEGELTIADLDLNESVLVNKQPLERISF